MKRAWLILVMMGIVSAPALCRAGAPPDYSPCGLLAQASETELAQNTGHGIDHQASTPNQQGRIVIWDEWAAVTGKGAAVSYAGQGSINYGQQRATFGASAK